MEKFQHYVICKKFTESKRMQNSETTLLELDTESIYGLTQCKNFIYLF